MVIDGSAPSNGIQGSVNMNAPDDQSSDPIEVHIGRDDLPPDIRRAIDRPTARPGSADAGLSSIADEIIELVRRTSDIDADPQVAGKETGALRAELERKAEELRSIDARAFGSLPVEATDDTAGRTFFVTVPRRVVCSVILTVEDPEEDTAVEGQDVIIKRGDDVVVIRWPQR
jgi:hypothetical protein